MRDYEIVRFFGLRKPRSTKKISNEKNNLNQIKFNIIFRNIFNHKISYDLIKRYFKVHDITEIFFSIGNKLIKDDIYVDYFSCIKDFEELRKFI